MKPEIDTHQNYLTGTIYIRYLDTSGIDYEVWIDPQTDLVDTGMEVTRGLDDNLATVRGLPAWLTIA